MRAPRHPDRVDGIQHASIHQAIASDRTLDSVGDWSLSAILDDAPFGVCIVDARLTVCAANRRVHAVLAGMGPVVGRDFAEIVRSLWPDPVVSEALERIRDTLSNGQASWGPALNRAWTQSAGISFSDWQVQRVAMRDGTPAVACYFYDRTEHSAPASVQRPWADLTLRVSEQLLQRTRALEELADTRLLQRLSAQLIEGHDSTSLYETIVDAAMSIMRSDFASLQMLHPDRGNGGELQLIASRGFNDEAKTFWEWVGKGRVSPCAVALGTGTRVIAADMERCEFLDRTLLDYGVLAAQSTPLVSRGGRMLGMISTHWRRPHMPSERDLRLLDILARQAADLMERTQADEALRQSESRLKEADRRKDEFLAMLAHELRNPLAPLRTCIELIRLAGDTPDAVAGVRTMMEEQVGHMVRLIDDLLDVSRITSGKIRLQRERAALEPLLDAAAELHREAFQSAGVSLVVDRPDRPVFLEADPTRFIQVLSNVLHNAVKFTNAGGRVQVSTAVTDAGGDGPGELTLRVTDTGIGISSEMLPRVFDLFSQDEGAIRRADDGLGIGLALARCLMELHGGSIQAESGGPGLGSTFTIRLPVAASAALPEPVAPPVVTARVRRRVVAIDDNVSAATAMRRLVRALGGECWVAGDGETGLKQVAAVRPDMIFIDIGMPGIDGYETCRRIRREVGPEVVVVAMTGWGREQDKAAAARAGFDLHLTKPADPFVLEGLLTDPDIRRFIPDRPTI